MSSDAPADEEHKEQQMLNTPASACIEEKLLTRMREVFVLFDKDQDGAVSFTEVGALLRSIGLNPSEVQIRDVQKKFERGGKKQFEFATFMAMVSSVPREGDSETEVVAALRQFDPRRTGRLSAADLRLALLTRGEPLDEQEVDLLLALADVNRRGDIRYLEFARKLLRDF